MVHRRGVVGARACARRRGDVARCDRVSKAKGAGNQVNYQSRFQLIVPSSCPPYVSFRLPHNGSLFPPVLLPPPSGQFPLLGTWSNPCFRADFGGLGMGVLLDPRGKGFPVRPQNGRVIALLLRPVP